MSTVIFTFCARSGMPSGHLINSNAFCALADIPDIWLRTQTNRASELVVDLNSENSAAGATARARLCAITKTSDLQSALNVLRRKKNFPRKGHCRMIQSLRHLRKLGASLVTPTESPGDPILQVISEIQRTLQVAELKNPTVIAYTDGSTSTKSKSKNSGCGIYITDSLHRPLWSNGFIVRSDGSNFLAEIAAAAVVIKALPTNFSLVKDGLDDNDRRIVKGAGL